MPYELTQKQKDLIRKVAVNRAKMLLEELFTTLFEDGDSSDEMKAARAPIQAIKNEGRREDAEAAFTDQLEAACIRVVEQVEKLFEEEEEEEDC